MPIVPLCHIIFDDITTTTDHPGLRQHHNQRSVVVVVVFVVAGGLQFRVSNSLDIVTTDLAIVPGKGMCGIGIGGFE